MKAADSGCDVTALAKLPCKRSCDCCGYAQARATVLLASAASVLRCQQFVHLAWNRAGLPFERLAAVRDPEDGGIETVHRGRFAFLAAELPEARVGASAPPSDARGACPARLHFARPAKGDMGLSHRALDLSRAPAQHQFQPARQSQVQQSAAAAGWRAPEGHCRCRSGRDGTASPGRTRHCGRGATGQRSARGRPQRRAACSSACRSQPCQARFSSS